MPVLQFDTEALAHRVERAHCFGHHFLADAVARNHGNTIFAGHVLLRVKMIDDKKHARA